MPTRKSPPPDDAPEDPAAAATTEAVAPAADPPGDDQVEITLPDGSVGVVDKVFADAYEAAQKKPEEAGG